MESLVGVQFYQTVLQQGDQGALDLFTIGSQVIRDVSNGSGTLLRMDGLKELPEKKQDLLNP